MSELENLRDALGDADADLSYVYEELGKAKAEAAYHQNMYSSINALYEAQKFYIAELEEAGRILASTAFISGGYGIWQCRGCNHIARSPKQVQHNENCPTLKFLPKEQS